MKLPKTKTHHGTCDMCKERNILILHLNYDEQPNNDFRICQVCLTKYIKSVN